MRQPIKTSRGVALIGIVAFAVLITVIFLTKNGEIEIQKITNSISSENRKVRRVATVEKDNGTDFRTEEWKLISGNPEDICTIPVYEGKTLIRVWYIYGSGYGNKKEWLLKIAPADIAKLPLFEANKERQNFHLKVKLENASEELEQKLKKASEENPVEIRVSRYLAYCEEAELASIRKAENM